LINSTLSHYRVISKVGAGGMGEVYLAQDTKLDRKVALKILPPQFAADTDRMARFVREAKSASALNHPNIITIYEIGESEGTHFIATEFINGKTLNQYLKDNQQDSKSLLELAIQIASALDEAHSAGIVHRDIKPDNVMVRGNGLAKILDFGIAKVSGRGLSDEAATAIKSGTSPGIIIGTANYMSPEQATGKEIDARTDIFSFGVVLYEMVSDRLPFAGDTAVEMIGAILRDEPKELSATVPVQLKTIICKCLRKDREKRYQRITDVYNDLKDLKQELEFQHKLERTSAQHREEPARFSSLRTTEQAQQQSQTRRQSIVVLPFANIGSDGSEDYFSDGLTEELISDLSKIRSLKVISRNSAMKLKGTTKDLRTIVSELDIRYVSMAVSAKQVRTCGFQFNSSMVYRMQTSGPKNIAGLWMMSFKCRRVFRAQSSRRYN
jgi:serine/threonine protein kinase